MREKAYLKQDVSVSSFTSAAPNLLYKTDLDDAAQAFIDIARNNSMTGQRIQVGMFSQPVI